MRNYVKFVAVGLALTTFLLGAGLGLKYGVRLGKQSVKEQVKLADEREAKILEVIVKRNPEATIKDFAQFPRHLLTQSEYFAIDYRLVMAIIDKESQFNPRAVGAAGEIGLMQIMPNTGKLMAVSLQLDWQPPTARPGGGYASLGTLGDPYANVHLGLGYFREAINQFGVGPVALRAYNRGFAQAREHRPNDRYAEDIGFKYLTLAHAIRD